MPPAGCVARSLGELDTLHDAADALFSASYLRWLQLARPALVGAVGFRLRLTFGCGTWRASSCC